LGQGTVINCGGGGEGKIAKAWGAPGKGRGGGGGGDIYKKLLGGIRHEGEKI